MSNEVNRKIENQNFIVFGGLAVASLGVLYFYKFHFATIAVSYVLGCLACYYGLQWRTLLGALETLGRRLADEAPDIVEGPKGCVTCGEENCSRHDTSATDEPWVGLKVHKQLDQAIEDFYNAILEQFVSTWYVKITPQPFFVDELRQQLRYASACLLRRAIKINYSKLITERLLPCALRHYTMYADVAESVSLVDSKLAIHPAAANRNAELHYLRSITNAVMPYLLKNDDLQSSVFRVLIREIFSGWVLLPLTDVLADPYILNTLIVLATGDDTVAPLPDTPNYKVEFLETFVRQIDSVYTRRVKMLRLDLDSVLGEQEYFYAFMQFMKSTGHFHLLQFCKDIKSFQIRILNPELTREQQAALFSEAWQLWVRYFDPESPTAVPLEGGLAEEMRLLLAAGTPDVRKLQTSRALYQAARQAHLRLERLMLPRFLHSDEYYKIALGQRTPPGYHKKMTKPEAQKPGTKLRGALRTQTLDGRLLDGTSSNPDLNIDLMDNINLLKYLAQEEALREQDLSTCKVVLTHVETRTQASPRRGTVRVFTVTVHRIDPVRADATLWTLQRSEHDFHLLRSKLLEFHGEAVLQHLTLPSRRDNSPLETIRYKYEDFLQRLLQMSLLQTSELLRIFLLEEGDFSAAVHAASLNAANSDLTNIYQTVTHRLRKEKGQHLESFMNALLLSSDKDRWDQARREVEVAQEVDEQYQLAEKLSRDKQRTIRDIHSSVFLNNFGVEPRLGDDVAAAGHQDVVVGFTQCFIYFLVRVVRARGVFVNIVGSVASVARTVLDYTVNKYLTRSLGGWLSERRLAHLVRLGHGILFDKKSSHGRENAASRRERARASLSACVPAVLALLAGGGTPSTTSVFLLIQNPQLNKQLVYNLMDLCLVELFPELAAIRTDTTKE